MSEPVKSPCISVCALDENDVCMGCYRHMREIADWPDYSDEQKREVILKANERCKQRYVNLT